METSVCSFEPGDLSWACDLGVRKAACCSACRAFLGSVSGESLGRQVGEETLMTSVCPVSVKLLTTVRRKAAETSWLLGPGLVYQLGPVSLSRKMWFLCLFLLFALAWHFSCPPLDSRCTNHSIFLCPFKYLCLREALSAPGMEVLLYCPPTQSKNESFVATATLVKKPAVLQYLCCSTPSPDLQAPWTGVRVLSSCASSKGEEGMTSSTGQDCELSLVFVGFQQLWRLWEAQGMCFWWRGSC